GDLDAGRKNLLTFTRCVTRLRRTHPAFRRRQVVFGRPIHGSEVQDVTWFRCDGKEMTQDDWTKPITRCFGLRLAGDAILEPDALGQRIVDDTFLVMLNAHHEPMGFTVPAHRDGTQWETVLDTREPTGKTKRRAMPGGETYDLEARSLGAPRRRRDSRPDRLRCRESDRAGGSRSVATDNMGGFERPPNPPPFGAPRQSRGAPLSHARGAAGPVRLAQQSLDELAGGVPREVRVERHLARRLVVGDVGATEFHQLGFGGVVAGAGLDGRVHVLAP